MVIHSLHTFRQPIKKPITLQQPKPKKTMGQALNGCQNCTTTTPTNSNSSLNEISTYYSNRLTQFQQIQTNIPFYHNVEHSRLANDLRQRGQKFQDMVYPSQYLLGNGVIEWKRLREVFPKEGFSRGKQLFQFQYKGKVNVSKNLTVNLARSLLNLKKYPQLIQKLFSNCQLSSDGFYVCYFCLGGNIQKRVEIIVDDYIPVDQTGRYLFDQPQEGCGVWMVILQKVWAKVMTSYHHLEGLLPQYFFSQMTGVPLQRLYNPGDFLTSGKHQLQPNQSKYLKIFRDTPVQMIACIWQAANPDFITDINPPNFIIEIITETVNQQTKQYQLLPVKIQRFGNKLITLNPYNQSMYQLPRGQNIIHIYNKNKIKRQFNFVIHSKKLVNIHSRNQKQFQQAKRAMIRNQYKKIHKNIGAQSQYPQIQFRFCWLNHRGIFCIKNKSLLKKRIVMNIKKQFLGEVYFEDSKENMKFADLGGKEYAFFVVIRAEDVEYGQFYQISVQKDV